MARRYRALTLGVGAGAVGAVGAAGAMGAVGVGANIEAILR